MRKIRFISALLIVVLLVLVNAGSALNADSEDTVKSYIERFQNDTGCCFVSAAVYSGDRVSFYGDPDALYQIGSMTKAFTGLAVQKLISGGKISPDNKVSEILPWYLAYYDSSPCEITIFQLLCQTSGYTNSETEYPGAEIGMSLQEWAAGMSGKNLHSVPGEKYAYSNVNYNLLGAVIERVTGRSYRDYMENEIFAPLGLNDTRVVPDHGKDNIIKGSRLGYRKAFTYEIPVAEGRIPAGYFYSNAKDMARWMQIWMGIADIPEEYKDIVSKVKDRLKESGDYYSGWEVTRSGDIGHSGGTPNYSSRMVFSKTEKFGALVLTNLNVAASTDSLCNGLFSLVKDGMAGDIAKDVWTIFDIIFSAVSAAGILLAGYVLFARKRKALLITGIFLLLPVISVCTVMPLIFGAGLGEMMRVWAPYSFTGGLTLLVTDLIVICIRVLILGNNEDRKKTS